MAPRFSRSSTQSFETAWRKNWNPPSQGGPFPKIGEFPDTSSPVGGRHPSGSPKPLALRRYAYGLWIFRTPRFARYAFLARLLCRETEGAPLPRERIRRKKVEIRADYPCSPPNIRGPEQGRESSKAPADDRFARSNRRGENRWGHSTPQISADVSKSRRT